MYRWAAKEAAIKAHSHRRLRMNEIATIRDQETSRPVMSIDPPRAFVRMTLEVAKKRGLNIRRQSLHPYVSSVYGLSTGTSHSIPIRTEKRQRVLQKEAETILNTSEANDTELPGNVGQLTAATEELDDGGNEAVEKRTEEDQEERNEEVKGGEAGNSVEEESQVAGATAGQQEQQEAQQSSHSPREELYWRYKRIKVRDRQEADVTISHDGEYVVAFVQALDEPLPNSGETEIIIDDGEGPQMHEPLAGDRGGRKRINKRTDSGRGIDAESAASDEKSDGGEAS